MTKVLAFPDCASREHREKPILFLVDYDVPELDLRRGDTIALHATPETPVLLQRAMPANPGRMLDLFERGILSDVTPLRWPR